MFALRMAAVHDTILICTPTALDHPRFRQSHTTVEACTQEARCNYTLCNDGLLPWPSSQNATVQVPSAEPDDSSCIILPVVRMLERLTGMVVGGRPATTLQLLAMLGYSLSCLTDSA